MVIILFVLDGLIPKKVHTKLTEVYGDPVPSISIVNKLAAEFKHGCTSLKGDLCEAWPKAASKPENIQKVHDIVLDTRRMLVDTNAEPQSRENGFETLCTKN